MIDVYNMFTEKKPILPTTTTSTDDYNNDDNNDIELAPFYEDGPIWWYIVLLWRCFIFFIGMILLFLISLSISIYNFGQDDYHYIISFIIFSIFLEPFVYLPIALLLGQYDFFYLLFCRHFIFKYIFSMDYFFNQISI
ncbi:unnamed protein product [Cunninghamella echinulata]